MKFGYYDVNEHEKNKTQEFSKGFPITGDQSVHSMKKSNSYLLREEAKKKKIRVREKVF